MVTFVGRLVHHQLLDSVHGCREHLGGATKHIHRPAATVSPLEVMAPGCSNGDLLQCGNSLVYRIAQQPNSDALTVARS